MKFQIQRRTHPKEKPVSEDNFEIAKKFAAAMRDELKDFIKAIVLFGSVARNDQSISEPDIDVLLIVDDLTLVMNEQVIEAYRIITERTAAKISKRLHITTMKLTNFWERARDGDPVAINMLRDGYPLYDTGFFEPIQQLLYEGRIKPTRESIYTYFARAPVTLANADWHLLQGVLDLYWAVIDSANAALMSLGEVPPSPRHVSGLIYDKMVRPGKLHKRYAKTMETFFELNKGILHRSIPHITGKEYDNYRLQAREFVTEMQRIVEHK